MPAEVITLPTLITPVSSATAAAFIFKLKRDGILQPSRLTFDKRWHLALGEIHHNIGIIRTLCSRIQYVVCSCFTNCEELPYFSASAIYNKYGLPLEGQLMNRSLGQCGLSPKRVFTNSANKQSYRPTPQQGFEPWLWWLVNTLTVLKIPVEPIIASPKICFSKLFHYNWKGI